MRDTEDIRNLFVGELMRQAAPAEMTPMVNEDGTVNCEYGFLDIDRLIDLVYHEAATDAVMYVQNYTPLSEVDRSALTVDMKIALGVIGKKRP